MKQGDTRIMEEWTRDQLIQEVDDMKSEMRDMNGYIKSLEEDNRFLSMENTDLQCELQHVG